VRSERPSDNEKSRMVTPAILPGACGALP
jgi:hypothetical protein